MDYGKLFLNDPNINGIHSLEAQKNNFVLFYGKNIDLYESILLLKLIITGNYQECTYKHICIKVLEYIIIILKK